MKRLLKNMKKKNYMNSKSYARKWSTKKVYVSKFTALEDNKIVDKT